MRATPDLYVSIKRVPGGSIMPARSSPAADGLDLIKARSVAYELVIKLWHAAINCLRFAPPAGPLMAYGPRPKRLGDQGVGTRSGERRAAKGGQDE